MYIAIYNRVFESSMLVYMKELFNLFQKNNITPVIFEGLLQHIKEQVPSDLAFEVFSELKPLHPKTKFLMSFGGDGTLLDTVQFIGNKQIPVLGINFGRLGFLASTSTDDIAFAIDSLLKGSYLLDERSLVHVEASQPIFTNAPFALNEFSIHRKDSSSMIKIKTFLNGEFLCTYWSDGLIVSTPTGSTGYSLSCGGPIVFPQANSFVITPVAPHNLNVRPIVIADSSIVSFEVEGRAEHFLCTLDARSESIDSHISLAVRKEDFLFKLVRLEGQNFLNTLQTKMYWGADRRN
ncbi:MAG: NAD kinase [Chitinophagaceae bacterium]